MVLCVVTFKINLFRSMCEFYAKVLGWKEEKQEEEEAVVWCPGRFNSAVAKNVEKQEEEHLLFFFP